MATQAIMSTYTTPLVNESNLHHSVRAISPKKMKMASSISPIFILLKVSDSFVTVLLSCKFKARWLNAQINGSGRNMVTSPKQWSKSEMRGATSEYMKVSIQYEMSGGGGVTQKTNKPKII